MAKLIVSALFLAALITLTITKATNYTTVVTTTTTTTTEDVENPESCQQQMQPEMINHCHTWMMKKKNKVIDYYSIVMQYMIKNPMEQLLKQCCDQLKSIQSECRCDAIRSMMNEMSSSEYGGKMEEMMGVASSLPGRYCGMKEPAYCQMRQMKFQSA